MSANAKCPVSTEEVIDTGTVGKVRYGHVFAADATAVVARATDGTAEEAAIKTTDAKEDAG